MSFRKRLATFSRRRLSCWPRLSARSRALCGGAWSPLLAFLGGTGGRSQHHDRKIDAPFLRPGDDRRIAPRAGELKSARDSAPGLAHSRSISICAAAFFPSMRVSFTHRDRPGERKHSAGKPARRGKTRLAQFAAAPSGSVHWKTSTSTSATPATVFAFRGLALSASEIESGKFFAHKIFVTSPMLRQTFYRLRGATSWENDHLTIAGLSLAPGLDLEALDDRFLRPNESPDRSRF